MGNIINDSFDDDLNGWEVYEPYRGYVRIIDPGQVTIFAYACASANMRQTFTLRNNISIKYAAKKPRNIEDTFDYKAILIVDGVEVASYALNPVYMYLTLNIDTTEYYGKEGTLIISLTPKPNCTISWSPAFIVIHDILVTPCIPEEWKCKQPLNSLEHDGCGNIRENPICNPYGSVNISTIPEGATIYIDGELIYQTTPTLIENLDEGIHELILELDLYETYAETFEIRPNQVTNINVELISLTGDVNISSIPEGATVYIDSELIYQRTPVLVGSLDIGTHELIIDLNLYETHTGTFDIYPGQLTSINVELIPLTGDLFINSTPDGADIYIDDTYQNSVTPAYIYDIFIGTHTYKLIRRNQEIIGTFEIFNNMLTEIAIGMSAGEISEKMPTEKIPTEKIPTEKIPEKEIPSERAPIKYIPPIKYR